MKTLLTPLTILCLTCFSLFVPQKARANTPAVANHSTTAGTKGPSRVDAPKPSRRNLGQKKSDLRALAAGLTFLLITDLSVSAVMGLGNVVAMFASSGQLGWGAVGSLWFGLHAWLFLNTVRSPNVVGISLLVFHGALAALSLRNLWVGATRLIPRRHRSLGLSHLPPHGSKSTPTASLLREKL